MDNPDQGCLARLPCLCAEISPERVGWERPVRRSSTSEGGSDTHRLKFAKMMGFTKGSIHPAHYRWRAVADAFPKTKACDIATSASARGAPGVRRDDVGYIVAPSTQGANSAPPKDVRSCPCRMAL